ncbi:hypothetical protein NK6_1842 [Bradyrhizobium diazoefficiens]|uniref:Uncharacterized protein n=1 Tax=Bradyrhizobium diazoefficiens TaxID=1355477 RepID=A0A0E4BM68_9BRAD|nr:hypothetical protein NK6_1842 [Bradyrhizobium diazoefficiens]
MKIAMMSLQVLVDEGLRVTITEQSHSDGNSI